MMPFRILSWTGKVEEHFSRHVQGLEVRKNSRRTREKTDRRARGGKGTPKEARAGLGLHKQVGRVAGRRQASLEEEARRRKVAHAPSRVAGGKNARGRRVDGFLVPVLWDKLEISSRRSLRCRKNRRRKVRRKFAGKVAGGECFLTTIRLTGKCFLPWL